jgi:hypothetical protein
MIFSIYIHILKKFQPVYLLLLALFAVSCAWSMLPHNAIMKTHHRAHHNHPINVYRQGRKLFGARFPPSDPDLSNNNNNQTPRPKILSPKRGTHPELEKFMMMYTCKVRLYDHQ